MRFKVYKYRIYPTKEQAVLIAKTIGCCRYVYNRALAIKMELYKKDKKSISIFQLINEIVKWKKIEETKWLKEVNSQALQQSLGDLDRAYTNFFRKKGGFPKFKSKCNKGSFRNPQGTLVDWKNNSVSIPKFKNEIKCILDQKFEGKIKYSAISKTPTEKYFISILVEENIDNPKPTQPKESKTLGIDLGIKHYATFSNGEKIENPKFLEKKLRKLRREQRRLSRKKKESKNRDKQRKKVARIHEKVSNSRKDFIHKLTHKLIENQEFSSFAIENLSVQNMMKNSNKKLARHIGGAGWYMFRQFLKYKCEWYGKNLLIVGRFEPSSRLCNCGYYNEKLTLKDREWQCPQCNIKHDRDILAANNIRRFAICEQNTSKIKNKNLKIPQELREFTPLEFSSGETLKKEIVKVI